MLTNDRLFDLAAELQSLAQAGLHYSKDKFDLQRFTRIREIAAELAAEKTGLDLQRIKDIFCDESGYQTPKIETRAAVFDEKGRILLIHEADGGWAMPGGWCETQMSVGESCLKELKEEAGMDGEIVKLIALMDHAKNNRPLLMHTVTKVFIECRALGGDFEPNIETTERGWFTPDALPEIWQGKNNLSQIEMCFKAHSDPNWKTYIE